jgi:hypothetical protein
MVRPVDDLLTCTHCSLIPRLVQSRRDATLRRGLVVLSTEIRLDLMEIDNARNPEAPSA